MLPSPSFSYRTQKIPYKKIALFFTLLVLSLHASASDGYCTATNGTIATNFDLGNKPIEDPTKNIPGYIYPPQPLSTTNGQAQGITCACTGGPYKHIWLWGDTSLPSGGYSSDGFNYYDIPNNDYIQVGMSVNTVAYGDQFIPFGPTANQNTDGDAKYKCNTTTNLPADGTGSKIKVSLRIKKSFVGVSLINNQKIASLYWNIGDTGGTSHGGQATSDIYLSGNITVPQNCTINTGTQVVVDLGSFYSGDFKTIGQKPDSYTPKTFNVPIKCNDISATANLTLRLQGTASTGFSDALQSDNTDVGVVITDSSGNTLRPNDSTSTIPFTLDSGNEANVTLHTYPVSTTGNTPAEGIFTTLAYLRVDFS